METGLVLTFASLCLHAFIEAMPFGLDDVASAAHDHGHGHGGHHHHHDHGGGGWSLLFGIGLHMLPVGLP